MIGPGNSRAITSNQPGVHPDLIRHLRRYENAEYSRPIAQHTQAAFDKIAKQVALSGQSIILDSGCGVGASTEYLARHYPDDLVIGIDQSARRLQKNRYCDGSCQPGHLLLVQADCVDFWRLALDAGWPIRKHFILYPNPWPKKRHLKRRWHGHPVFRCMAELCGHVQVRSNWLVYVQEFALAWEYIGGAASRPYPIGADASITPFERKYRNSGQTLYALDLG